MALAHSAVLKANRVDGGKKGRSDIYIYTYQPADMGIQAGNVAISWRHADLFANLVGHSHVQYIYINK